MKAPDKSLNIKIDSSELWLTTFAVVSEVEPLIKASMSNIAVGFEINNWLSRIEKILSPIELFPLWSETFIKRS